MSEQVLTITGAERQELDPILDACVERFKKMSEEDGNEDRQIEVKSAMKSLCTFI